MNYTLGKDEKAQDFTRYLQVDFWESRAEAAAKLLEKGDLVIIEGAEFIHAEQAEKDGTTYLNERIVNASGFSKVNLG